VIDEEAARDGEDPRHHVGAVDVAGARAVHDQERLLQEILGLVAGGVALHRVAGSHLHRPSARRRRPR